jgi:hypothetical protein
MHIEILIREMNDRLEDKSIPYTFMNYGSL